jgi:hypothetical protein
MKQDYIIEKQKYSVRNGVQNECGRLSVQANQFPGEV